MNGERYHPNANPFDDGDVHCIPDPENGYVPEDRERWERNHPMPPDIAEALFEQEFDVLVKQRELKP